MKQHYLKLTAGGLQSRGIILARPGSHTGNLWQSCKIKQELLSPGEIHQAQGNVSTHSSRGFRKIPGLSAPYRLRELHQLCLNHTHCYTDTALCKHPFWNNTYKDGMLCILVILSHVLYAWTICFPTSGASVAPGMLACTAALSCRPCCNCSDLIESKGQDYPVPGI